MLAGSMMEAMDAEARRELIARRQMQILEGAREAVRREVEWLRRHNFPVWVAANGRVVDASKRRDRQRRER